MNAPVQLYAQPRVELLGKRVFLFHGKLTKRASDPLKLLYVLP
jgi:hypothetical protein